MKKKHLDLDRIKKQTCQTLEEISRELGIQTADLERYGRGESMPLGVLEDLLQYTGLKYEALFKSDGFEKTFSSSRICPDNTFQPSEDAKSSLLSYVQEGINTFHVDDVHQEIKKLRKCIKTLRKPRISFAGQSDTGKSCLINSLLGVEQLPAKWTPTTSIAVLIKHVDDRPSYMAEDVWIFGNHSDDQRDAGKLANDIFDKLEDEVSSKNYLLAKGDFSLLNTFGTHQEEHNAHELACCAVAFVDSPLLKDCDILDLPGFGVTQEDDEKHEFNTQQSQTDILIYLSRSNGFLQDRDLDYLNKCINKLKPVERPGNQFDKLENLFIVASQAGAVNNGNTSELKEIIRLRSEALCRICRGAAGTDTATLLPSRTRITGCNYTEEDIQARFFTYEKDLPRLCKQFNEAFTALCEKYPKMIYEDFKKELRRVADSSSELIADRIAEWEEMLKSQNEFAQLLREIKEHEPERIVAKTELDEEMVRTIHRLNTESQQEIESMYNATMTQSNLVALINAQHIKNKKEDKQDFTTMVNKLLSNNIEKILSEKADEYSCHVKKYLEDYSNTFKRYSAGKKVSVKFDTTNSFLMGLAGLGALGASATWLATSATAFGVFLFGPLMGFAPLFAVGGVIGIAVAAVITGVIAVVKGLTWKEELAKSIIKAYTKKDYITTIFKDVEQYWKDTEDSFHTGVDKVEEDWKAQLEKREQMVNEKDPAQLQKEIAEAYRGLDFFSKIPISNIG